MTRKTFYIKQRHNPQLGIYHIAGGQLTVKEAKEKESAVYDIMGLFGGETNADRAKKQKELER